MMLTIDPRKSRPIYLQVTDAIKELIARGKLRPGAPLPSTRQLASDLGVNLNTIATAYRELQNEGLVSIRHGSGCVVAARDVSSRRKRELSIPLRAALTELVLAGLSARKINQMVTQHLSLVSRPSH
jgi:GntR family transcriptional regulator